MTMITTKEYQEFLQKSEGLTDAEYEMVFSKQMLETCMPPYWFHDIEGAYKRYKKVLEIRKIKEATEKQKEKEF